MKLRTKKICIYGIIMGMLLVTVSVSLAVPVLKGKIRLNPTIPKPEDTVTFTADIEYYDYVDFVKLIVEECKPGLCYTDSFNESMADNGAGEYETEITLRHDDATEIKYHVEIKTTDGEWSKSSITELDLDTTGSSLNGGDNGNGSSDTSGFELIFSLMAVIVGFVLFRRKR